MNKVRMERTGGGGVLIKRVDNGHVANLHRFSDKRAKELRRKCGSSESHDSILIVLSLK